MNNSIKEYLKFDGNIIYHQNIDSANEVLTQLLDSIRDDNKIVVGFDCEWNTRPRRKHR